MAKVLDPAADGAARDDAPRVERPACGVDRPKAHTPITPGEILKEEFLDPLGISQYRLPKATGLPATRIGEIIRGKRRITTETAIRFSRALGLSERYWINIQADYDLEVEHDTHEADISRVEVLVS